MPRLNDLPAAETDPWATAVAMLEHTGWASAQKAQGAPFWRWLGAQPWATGAGQIGGPYPTGTLGQRLNLAAGLGDLPVHADAAAAAGSLPPGDLYRTPGGVIKAVPLNMVTVGVSPYQYGGEGDGVADDTAAVIAAMAAVEAQEHAWLDLSGGTWRLTSALPVLTRCIVNGMSTGTLFVDWALAAPVLRLQPPQGQTLNVTAVDIVTDYDWFGSFTGNSRVTRLTLSLTGGQTMPVAGTVCKLASKQQLIGVDAGDGTGQHIVVLSTAGPNVFAATSLFDPYGAGNPLNECQLIELSTAPVQVRGLRIKGRYDRVVTEDWRHSALEIIGARYPYLQDILVEDMSQGVMLLGCWMAVTAGCKAHRMRAATASETPAVSGYGMVDAGSFGTVHLGLDGYDCRHAFTTVTPTAVSWPKITWGRSILPSIVGGMAQGCASAAYDTHPDCVGASFIGLKAEGGYFGEQSDGCAIQLRGQWSKVINCRGINTQQGINIYKQLTGQGGVHTIDGFHYRGAGIGLRIDRAAGLSDIDKRQTVRLKDVDLETSAQNAMLMLHGDVDIEGPVRVRASGSTSGMAAAYLEQTVLSGVGGELIHDCRGFAYDVDLDPANPRYLNFSGAGSRAYRLKSRVILGDVLTGNVPGWLAAVAENDPGGATGSGPWDIELEADRLPDVAAGVYSQFGASNLLQAGTNQIRFLVNGPRYRLAVTTPQTISAGMAGWHFAVTSATTLTFLAANVLGPLFECFVHAIGVTVTLAGITTPNITLIAGTTGWIMVQGGVIHFRRITN